MRKRIVSVLLCAALLTGTVAMVTSCADTRGNKTTTGDGSLIDPGTGEMMHHVPEGVRFDGETITFAVAETDGDGFHQRSIMLDPDDIDASNKVDTAIQQRNIQVESDLGVTIELLGYYSNENIRASAAYRSLYSGSSEFDVIAGLQWSDVELCTEGFLADLNSEIDDWAGSPGQHVDWLGYTYGEPYWSNYYIDAMKCGDAVYWLTGDLCLRYTGGFYCFFVNSKIYEEKLKFTESDLLTQKYGTKTEYGDIYLLVKNGDWTLDVFNEMIAKAYVDTNGDEKADKSDQLGAAMPIWDNTNGMSVAAGVEYSKRDGDTISITANSRNNALITFMTKMNTILRSGYVVNYGGDYKGAMTDFASDKSCFVSGRLNQAELYLNNMATDYHIIPCPKMSFTQANYRSSVHDGINLYGINTFSEHKAAAAATLELMAYYSYKSVRPIYYDEALKSMYTNDRGAAEMIDLMGEVVYSDFVYIWQFADVMNGLGYFLRNNVTSKRPKSSVDRIQNQWAKGLESVLKDISEIKTDEK